MLNTTLRALASSPGQASVLGFFSLLRRDSGNSSGGSGSYSPHSLPGTRVWERGRGTKELEPCRAPSSPAGELEERRTARRAPWPTGERACVAPCASSFRVRSVRGAAPGVQASARLLPRSPSLSLRPYVNLVAVNSTWFEAIDRGHNLIHLLRKREMAAAARGASRSAARAVARRRPCTVRRRAARREEGAERWGEPERGRRRGLDLVI